MCIYKLSIKFSIWAEYVQAWAEDVGCDCAFDTHMFLWEQVESIKLSLKDFSVTQCPATALD